MNENLQISNSPEQSAETLFQQALLALSESAAQITSLGRCKVRFAIGSAGEESLQDLRQQMNPNEPDMLAVCHSIEGINAGEILFLVKEADGGRFIKELLNESVDLIEISNMEKEALLDVGNIIVNDFLSQFLTVLHQSVCTSMPTLKQGHYDQLFNQLAYGDGENEKECFVVKFSVEISDQNFVAYILWFDHLCRRGSLQAEVPQSTSYEG